MTSEVQECPQFQFLVAQLDNLLTPYNKIRYTKHLLILAGELLCISPAAYRMLRNSRTIILPWERLLRDLMTRSFQNNELPRIFEVLKPEQRFVNILFDEVKLIKTSRFSAGHIIGHANNAPSEQATSALCNRSCLSSRRATFGIWYPSSEEHKFSGTPNNFCWRLWKS